MSRKNNPYVGPVPYQEGDTHLLVGREEEGQTLLSLIVSEGIVLFYGPSGAGKSSLLNKMVLPGLRERGFNTLPICRVGGEMPASVDRSKIKNVFAFNLLMCLADTEDMANSFLTTELAQALKTKQETSSKPQVLIIDQFEEIFTTHQDHWEHREAFFIQLRTLLEEDPTFSVLFVMREDQIASLDHYKKFLPRRLRSRFSIDLLRKEEAIEAILLPAKNAGVPFESPHIAEELALDLAQITIVGRKDKIPGEFVEPAQLQTVCWQIWESLDDADRVITRRQVARLGNVGVALETFYENAIKRITEKTAVEEGEVRRWFSEVLINARRLRAQGGQDTLSRDVVDALVNEYLVRPVSLRGANLYELTHDRLVDPILSSNERWKSKSDLPIQVAAKNWSDSNRDERFLLHGDKLRRATEWASANPGLVWDLERAFLSESERHASKRRYQLAAISASIALNALVLGIAAMSFFHARHGDARKTRTAHVRELDAIVRLNEDTDPSRSLLLALASATVSSKYPEDKETLRESQDTLNFALRAPQSPLILQDPTAELTGIAYDPSGEFLATSSAAGTVQIWDSITGRPEQSLHSSSKLSAVAFSPIGRILAAAGEDGNATIWEAKTQPGERHTKAADKSKTVWEFRPPKILTPPTKLGPISAISFSPDGTRLAAAYQENMTLIWDTTNGKILKRLESFNKSRKTESDSLAGLLSGRRAVKSVAFSPDGQLLVTGNDDGSIQLWNSSSLNPVLELNAHKDNVYAVSFSRDGKEFATGGEDSQALLWSVEELRKKGSDRKPLYSLSGHGRAIRGLSFNPDGSILATASEDGSARLWTVSGLDGGTICAGKSVALAGHKGIVYSVAFSPDGGHLGTAGEDRTARVWAAEIPAEVSGLTHLSFSPDGRKFAAAGPISVVIYDASTNEVISRYFSYLTQKVIFSEDGRHYASVDASGFVLGNGDFANALFRKRGRCTSAAFSHDGTYLVTACEDELQIRNADSGDVVRTVSTKGAPVFLDLEFDRIRDRVITLDQNGTVTAWDINTQTSDDDSRRRILLQAFPSGSEGSQAVIAPSGQFLAVVEPDRDITIRDLNFVSKIRKLGRAAGRVSAIAFSADGNSFARAADNDNIGVWDLKSSESAIPISSHARSVNGLAFSPDGKRLLTADSDDRLLLHFLDITELFTEAWIRVARQLDPVECQHYLEMSACPAEYEEFLKAKGLTLNGKLDEALAELRKAEKLNSTIPADPNSVLNRIRAHLLLEKSQISAWNGDVDGVLDAYKQSNQIYSDAAKWPEALPMTRNIRIAIQRMVLNGRVEEAKVSYMRAVEFSPSLKQDAVTINYLCWFGSLWGYANTVMEFCNEAVSLRPGNANFVDSRGVALALSGKFGQAAMDFETFVKSEPLDWDASNMRKAWIRDLRAGRNPFTILVRTQLLRDAGISKAEITSHLH
jgi:WD40 repeat protein